MKLPPQVKAILGDVRFWIILFFCIRLINITNPPLEIAHNWRQTIGTMVSRNFMEEEVDLLRPRLDIGGEHTGITGMEFPSFNYLTYLVDSVLGYTHWHGRLVSLIFTSLGCWFFFLTIRRFIDKEVAYNATLILLASLWFAYGRKILPDTYSASLTIMAIYYGLRYLYDASSGAWWKLTFVLVFYALGVSSKLSSASLMMVFLIPLFDGQVPVKRKVILSMVGLIGAIPIAYWYVHWVPYLVETYKLHHFFMGQDFSVGLRELWETRWGVAHRFYDNTLKYVGFAMFLYGTAMAFKHRTARVYLYILVSAFALFVIFMAKAGDNIAGHSYYLLAIVPVLALVAGYGVKMIPWKWFGTLLLAAILIEGVANQQHDFRIKEDMSRLEHLDDWLHEHSKKDDLLMINSGLYPTSMYFAHRKGWVMPTDQITPAAIDSMADLGLKHILILKRTFDFDKVLNLPILKEDEDFRLYKVEKRMNP